ncbi:HD domain-containing protein [Bacillus sp. CMF21]|uniref:HD domain-containing protein n=1 Tax=Metabacillus dongyingensis TaxID=2874282 RepID=UPI001CBBD037|nr:HD domain-containing protein [Metabacillus dongyingensis]UAL53989.1 HD domain-containing protein [Metabacillus dongyingensis]USK30305.1 HD domain-containing protein [Bacillus sp. CMF21]
MNLTDKAKRFAERAHEGQIRRLDGGPYFTHVENTALTLFKAGFREEVVAAGFLHDAVEDTETSIAQIKDIFGGDVASLVAFNTEDKSLTWEERKQHTIQSASLAGIEEKAILAADKLDNLESLLKENKKHGDDIWRMFNRGKDKQAWYHRSISENLFKNLEPKEIPSFFFVYKRLVKEFFSE